MKGPIMNSDTLKGDVRDIGGKGKEILGDATGDTTLKNAGVTDQISGSAQKAYGTARDAVGPLADKARGFAKERPFAAAALAGVLGIALLNTLRGRR